MRDASLKGANLRGAYFMKVVAYRTNFEGADMTDVLADRGVFVEANLKNAVLVRSVFTSSDLRDANIEGADFTDALLDRDDQEKLCSVASGKNPTTGVDTRRSLGCRGAGRAVQSSPSAYMSDENASQPKMDLPASRFSAYQGQ